MIVEDNETELRERLAQAFEAKTTVNISTAARLLKMSEKTLRRHIAEGNIGFRAVGTGSLRMRREFTVSDLVGFYEGRSQRECAVPTKRGRPLLRRAAGLSSFLQIAES